MRYHVTRIKSEIIKAQKARKTLGKLNWAIQLSSFLSFKKKNSYNEVRQIVYRFKAKNLENSDLPKRKEKISLTLYGFRDDANIRSHRSVEGILWRSGVLTCKCVILPKCFFLQGSSLINPFRIMRMETHKYLFPRGNEPLLYHQLGNRDFFIFITNQ